MNRWLEKLLARLWNRTASRRHLHVANRDLDLGMRTSDDEVSQRRVTIPQNRRAEHVAVLGKTGTGKSSLLRYLAKQDIESGRGFVYFDLHGDATPFLIGAVAAQERVAKQDLSNRLIVIEPADPEFSVGVNPLEEQNHGERFVQIAEFAQVLKQRWHLESFGARTDELLRNSLYVLAENGHTLLELAPLLEPSNIPRQLPQTSSPIPRSGNTSNSAMTRLSEPMRATMREPILNKMSAFTADQPLPAHRGPAALDLFGPRSDGPRLLDYSEPSQRQAGRTGGDTRKPFPHDDQERTLLP